MSIYSFIIYIYIGSRKKCKKNIISYIPILLTFVGEAEGNKMSENHSPIYFLIIDSCKGSQRKKCVKTIIFEPF